MTILTWQRGDAPSSTRRAGHDGSGAESPAEVAGRCLARWYERGCDAALGLMPEGADGDASLD
jgi:hypothetical protein